MRLGEFEKIVMDEYATCTLVGVTDFYSCNVHLYSVRCSFFHDDARQMRKSLCWLHTT